jgi:hypothetical protein
MPLPPKKKFDMGEYVDGMFDNVPSELLSSIPANSKVSQIDTIDPRQALLPGVQPGVYDNSGVANVISPFQVIRPDTNVYNIPLTASRRTAPDEVFPTPRGVVDDMFADLPSDLGGPPETANSPEQRRLAAMYNAPRGPEVEPNLQHPFFDPDTMAEFLTDAIAQHDLPPPPAERLMAGSGPARMAGSAVASGKKPKR